MEEVPHSCLSLCTRLRWSHSCGALSCKQNMFLHWKLQISLPHSGFFVWMLVVVISLKWTEILILSHLFHKISQNHPSEILVMLCHYMCVYRKYRSNTLPISVVGTKCLWALSSVEQKMKTTKNWHKITWNFRWHSVYR